MLKIAVDFDGTIVKHQFPNIGSPNPGAIDYLKMFKELGAQLILWTMRSDGQEVGDVLTEAVEYCRKNGIEFDAVNEGINDREWTTSNKAYANIYIDHNAAGCPLKNGMVDWLKIGPGIADRIKREE